MAKMGNKECMEALADWLCKNTGVRAQVDDIPLLIYGPLHKGELIKFADKIKELLG